MTTTQELATINSLAADFGDAALTLEVDNFTGSYCFEVTEGAADDQRVIWNGERNLVFATVDRAVAHIRAHARA